MKLTTLFICIFLIHLLPAQTFTEVPSANPFEGVWIGSIAFSDVDGDGDPDVLISGLNGSSARTSKLYTNSGSGNFTEVVGTPFDGVFSSSVVFSDVDGDGDPDVLISGFGNNFSVRIAKLYINDGTGYFTEAIGTPFEGVGASSTAFSDVEGDGDQDVLITGENVSGVPISKLYTNDGSGNFTEVTGTPFEGVGAGSIAFSDVDGDGDPDVLITGENGSGVPISKLYTNDGMGNFTVAMGTPFQNVYIGSTAFSDVDGDGDQDVLITGSDIFSAFSKLYTNDGAGNFTEVVNTPFVGVDFSSIAFSDVDGDGDPDVLITGSTGSAKISKLYTNNGSGDFTEAVGTPFDDVGDSSIAFADVDKDGDPDVLITGSTGSAKISKLFTNDGAGIFIEPVGTPFDGVQQGSVAFSDVDGDMNPDVLIAGFANSRITKLYTNDGMGNFTEKTGTPFDGVFRGSIAFSDIDGDNDPDVLITGYGNSITRIAKLYINDGMGIFTEKNGTPFVGVDVSSIAFSDVDGDTDEDVLITGSTGAGSIAKLYTNDGLGNFSEKTGTPFDGVELGSIAFSDVDGDNDPDVLITGWDGSTEIAKLFTNDGLGNFSEKTGTPFDGVVISSIAFSDVDGDNDPDVLITGEDGSFTIISKLYLNDGMGNFSKKNGTPFVSVYRSSVAFSDIDGDNDPDVLITGEDNSSILIAKLYTNDGMGNFSEVMSTPFEGVSRGSIAFSDVDGDTDEDVLITGYNGSTGIAKLYTNDRIMTSIEEIGSTQDKNILLYPNPSKNGEVFIDYLSDKHNILEISLMSIEGRIRLQQYSPVTSGSNKITVSYPTLPSGWYIIKLDDGIRSRYVKLVVE